MQEGSLVIQEEVSHIMAWSLITNDFTPLLSIESGLSKEIDLLKKDAEDVSERVEDVENQVFSQELIVKYTDLNKTDEYSTEDGSLIGTSASFKSKEFKNVNEYNVIKANFEDKNPAFGILLYNKDSNFIKFIESNVNIEYDYSNDNVGKIIVQTYQEWTNTEITFISYALSDVKTRLKRAEDNIEEQNAKLSYGPNSILDVSYTYDFSFFKNNTQYSMVDGSVLGTHTSYLSFKITNIEGYGILNAKFDGTHQDFGVIFFDTDGKFVKSISAKEEVEYNFINDNIGEIIVQTYTGWKNTSVELFNYSFSKVKKDVAAIKKEIDEQNEIVTIIAKRNEEDYNSIRDIINSITDASEKKKYIIKVPVGRWFESDIQGKEYVTIKGESRDGTILYCDGNSDKPIPSNYAYSQVEEGVPLSDVPQIYKHCVFAKKDIVIENLSIEVTNCKYCVHLDNGGYNKAIFRNCKFNGISGIHYVIGVGIHSGQSIIIENSILESGVDEKQGLFLHNWNNQSKPSYISVDKCYFKNCGFATIDELGSEQDDIWFITNSYCNGDKSLTFMVDKTSVGTTFWTNPETGEKETNPQNVPYNIKLNTLGSNVRKIKKQLFNNSIVARPEYENSLIANFEEIEIIE